jgi:hypothetical protein
VAFNPDSGCELMGAKKNRVPDFQTNPYYEPIKTQLFGGFKKIPKQ